jgi:hypothetical protein
VHFGGDDFRCAPTFAKTSFASVGLESLSRDAAVHFGGDDFRCAPTFAKTSFRFPCEGVLFADEGVRLPLVLFISPFFVLLFGDGLALALLEDLAF